MVDDVSLDLAGTAAFSVVLALASALAAANRKAAACRDVSKHQALTLCCTMLVVLQQQSTGQTGVTMYLVAW